MKELLRRLGLLLILSIATLFIAACATTARGSADFASQTRWEGRLALKVYATPVQAFASNFVLEGNGEAGSLSLHTPLGSTLAQMQWAPGVARLTTTGEPQSFDSLQALVLHATGAELPVAALFDWLQGTPTAAPDWEVDLSQLPEGRLNAQRKAAKLPAVDLKIILQN